MRNHPHLYELNARIWLRRLSDREGRRVTLATVPERDLRALAQRGMDLVWLMGIWSRSPGARGLALAAPELRRAYGEILPDWTEADIEGSPYAVMDYALDPALGAPEELPEFKARLNRLGLGLIVDFVTNHLALDHPWTLQYPGRFVRAGEERARSNPGWFFRTARGERLAYGRDPNFPPWTDTVQVDFFSPELRAAHEEILRGIAGVADGARCDMAMLALNRVFREVWGGFADAPTPSEEYWPPLIRRTRAARPGFIFLAESYWNLEWELQQAGFDFTYDKTLYDRLRFSAACDVAAHLGAEDLYQRRSARFIENHDEPRAAAAFGRGRSLAAAVVAAGVPGLRFFHDGQFEGKRLRLPIQLTREPRETADPVVEEFYARLLGACGAGVLHDGAWALLEVSPAWPENPSHQNLLAWTWTGSGAAKVFAVNLSPAGAQARVRIPLAGGAAPRLSFRDELAGKTYFRDADEIRSRGLYVDLGPWKAHLFDVQSA